MRDAAAILAQHGQQVERQLGELLLPDAGVPSRLAGAIGYSLFAGGKRLRPALVLESYAAIVECRAPSAEFGNRQSTIPNPSALAAAAAIELVHTFSLVHDDLPAMDNDDLRRGKPTSHKVFGEAMAILAGDAMMTMAFEILAADAEADLVPRMVYELASGAGPAGTIGGQTLDIDSENKRLSLDELRRLHRLKTGALLATSCRLGAIAARADDAKLAALSEYGEHLGLAFQIVDDILDVTSTPQQLGKATRKDADRGKNTYPALLGLDASRAEARRQLEAALEPLAVFGPSADGLRMLAKFVVERQT